MGDFDVGYAPSSDNTEGELVNGAKFLVLELALVGTIVLRAGRRR